MLKVVVLINQSKKITISPKSLLEKTVSDLIKEKLNGESFTITTFNGAVAEYSVSAESTVLIPEEDAWKTGIEKLVRANLKIGSRVKITLFKVSVEGK